MYLSGKIVFIPNPSIRDIMVAFEIINEWDVIILQFLRQHVTAPHSCHQKICSNRSKAIQVSNVYSLILLHRFQSMLKTLKDFVSSF